MVDDKDGSSTASARSTDEYWDRMVSWTAGGEHRRRTVERSRLFDHEAARYDRCRPRYPDVVIDALLGPEPAGLEVLDVGCGTGIAAVAMAERGAKVLGVELAPCMAEIAHRHGIEVEIGAFEEWDAADRSFDRVTSAQAWHWLDMPAATAKAASLLRPNGSLGLIWSGGAYENVGETWAGSEDWRRIPEVRQDLSRRGVPVHGSRGALSLTSACRCSRSPQSVCRDRSRLRGEADEGSHGD